MPSRKLNVARGSFFIEKQVDNAQMIFDAHGDFSHSKDYLWAMKTGSSPNYLVLSGSVETTEQIERGNYTLVGGYLRTYVSGMKIADGDGTTPTLQLYSLQNQYGVTEGGMKFSRITAPGTVTVTASSTTVTGVGTDFDGATGFFSDYFYYGNYQGGAFVWLGVPGSRKKYEVASIASDTSLTLTSNYTGTTTSATQLQLDKDVGDSVSTWVSTYGGPTVNFNEDFDGVNPSLSNLVYYERQGASAVVKKGYPYLLNSQCGTGAGGWGNSVYMASDANTTQPANRNVGFALVKNILRDCTYYPVRIDASTGFYEGHQNANPDGPITQSYLIENMSGDSSNITNGTIARNQAGEGMTKEAWSSGVIGYSRGRVYLKRVSVDAGDNNGQVYEILNRMGQATSYRLVVWGNTTSYVRYDSEQAFDPNPENTVTATQNNTIFDKVYSTFMYENPFTASTDVPIISSTVELQSDVLNRAGNAARLYHLWDYSPDNVDIQKYLGRDDSLNPQTAYMAKYNIPFPLVQDMALDRIGDRRTYLPYISMDMNVAKLFPSVLYDIQNYLGSTLTTASGNFINQPGTKFSGSQFQNAKWGATNTIRQKAMTFLRSVVITFSNYKPLDTHTCLEDFLQYGFDNAYGSSQSDESIVGGIVLSRLGMTDDNIDNSAIYAQSLPIVREDNTMGYDEQWYENASYKGFGLATIESGSGAGNLKQLLMKAVNLNNTSTATTSTPRVVQLPMNEYFNMKFYIDVHANQKANINSRNPYSSFVTSGSSGGVGMRCVFETETVNDVTDTTEDLYTNMAYLDLNFSCSGGNTNEPSAPHGNTPNFSFQDRFVSTHKVTTKYPKHMIIWVQNYRFVSSTEPQFAYGDNETINTANGSAIEAEVFIDNVKGADFYKDLRYVGTTGSVGVPITFPQGASVKSPLRYIENGNVDLTALNSGVSLTNGTDTNTTMQNYTPATYWSVGFDNKEDLPLSGSSTARRGYVLLSDYYTTSAGTMDQIIPDLYSGATISLTDGAYAGGLQNDRLGYELRGSSYADSGDTVGTDYYDPAVGNNQYATTGGKDVTTKICFGTGSSNNFLSTDGLTQKGFVNINIANGGNATSDAYGNWGKRENALVSTKVVDVPTGGNGLDTNQLIVGDTSIFNVYNPDEQYILYMVGFPESTAYYKILTLRGGLGSVNGNIVTFNESVTSGSTAQAIGQESQLSNLYISPYKYWVNMNTKGTEDYKNRSFTGVTLVNNNLSGATAASITGSTFNEVQYTFKLGNTGSVGQSASYDSKWNFLMDPEDEPAVELDKNWGYGVFDTETDTGGVLNYISPVKDDYNFMSIGNLLTDSSVQERGSFNLMARLKPSLYPTTIDLVGDDYNSTNQLHYKPTFIYEYKDAVPLVETFMVEPAFKLLDEDVNLYKLTTQNLNAVRFRWSVADDDIWYKMILLNKDGAIDNKYQNAQLWLPLNEAPPPAAAPTINWYNQITNTSGTATVGANTRSYIDGIQGYSPYISGNALGSASVRVPYSSNTAFKGLTEYTFSTHVTFDTTEAGQKCMILGQGTPGSGVILRKNDSDLIEYQHSGTTVTGASVIRCDGKTAYSIIVTYKYQSDAGPDLQLYVDGVTDGYVTDCHAAITATDHFEVGWYIATLPTGWGYFQGRVEECVLWDKEYIIPDGEEYVYNTSNLEDETSGKTNVWSARLFAFDFHNIRGKTFKEVASSPNISWRATPV